MANYKIEIKRSAEKELRSIPKKDITKIIEQIQNLAFDPMPKNSIKLTNDFRRRLKIGKYRVLYSIENEKLVIFVVKIAHRKKAYK